MQGPRVRIVVRVRVGVRVRVRVRVRESDKRDGRDERLATT